MRPLRKLRPLYLSYRGYDSERIVYIIAVTGGFVKTGYMIFESKDNIPSTNVLLPHAVEIPFVLLVN